MCIEFPYINKLLKNRGEKNKLIQTIYFFKYSINSTLIHAKDIFHKQSKRMTVEFYMHSTRPLKTKINLYWGVPHQLTEQQPNRIFPISHFQ